MVKYSQFTNNNADERVRNHSHFSFGNTSLGGGLGVMFDNAVGKTVLIMSSYFISCSSFMFHAPYFLRSDSGKTMDLSEYSDSGGGLSVLTTNNSRYNSIVIKNSHFEANNGTYGGGLYFTFIHNSEYNSILVENCTVAKNVATGTGGGLLISQWDLANANSIILKDCSLLSNTAMGGGGMKVIFGSNDPVNESRGGTIDFQMHNCNVFGNTATSGSALRFLTEKSSGCAPPLLPKLFNCTIAGHRSTRGSKVYPAAILSNKVGIEFHGMNYVINNRQGSAIYVSSGTLHVKGILIFENNTGLLGGAAYLGDASKIILYPDSYLRFSNNHAERRGGGLFVEAITL